MRIGLPSSRLGSTAPVATPSVSPTQESARSAEPTPAPREPSAQALPRAHRPTMGSLVGVFAPAISAVLIATSLMSAAPVQGAELAARPTVTTTARPALEGKDSTRTALYGALDRLLAQDTNKDGLVVGRAYGNELGSADALAKAVYNYADYANPAGTTSGFGATTRGDYSSGGLGLGFTLTPRHMTANSVLTESDLTQGVVELAKRITAGGVTQGDLRGTDLKEIATRAKASGLCQGMSDAQIHHAIHTAGEKLIASAGQLTGQAELSTGKEGAKITGATLAQAQPAGSLERIIAEVALSGNHATEFFAPKVWGSHLLNRDGTKPGEVGETSLHYLLEISKEAKLSGLALDVMNLIH